MNREDRIRFVARRYREDSLNPEAAWDDFARKHGIRRRTALRRYIWGAAAILLLLVGLSGRYWMEREAWITVATESRERKEVWLPDSTVVTLAESSSIRYDKKQYGKEQRAVKMNGKAFFQVARDEARPFSVQTRRAKVEVLGTTFQLEKSNDAVMLHVATGKVHFSPLKETEGVILTEGMSATYSESEGMQVEQEEPDANILAWKTRQLRFRNTSLDQVIRDVSEAYQVELINHTVGSEALQLTSYFHNLPLDDVLSVINETLDIRLEARPIN